MTNVYPRNGRRISDKWEHYYCTTYQILKKPKKARSREANPTKKAEAQDAEGGA